MPDIDPTVQLILDGINELKGSIKDMGREISDIKTTLGAMDNKHVEAEKKITQLFDFHNQKVEMLNTHHQEIKDNRHAIRNVENNINSLYKEFKEAKKSHDINDRTFREDFQGALNRLERKIDDNIREDTEVAIRADERAKNRAFVWKVASVVGVIFAFILGWITDIFGLFKG